MPEREMWETFFDTSRILAALGLDAAINDAAEFGCGYGTFTIPAAKIIKGTLFGFDIEPAMVRATNERARAQRARNVKAVVRDFIAAGSGLPDECVDYVMLFNILHLENPSILLGESRRILKKGGKLGIIHWNHDPATPRGPSMGIRPKPEECVEWAEAAGFRSPVRHDLKPYHYGIVFMKAEVLAWR